MDPSSGTQVWKTVAAQDGKCPQQKTAQPLVLEHGDGKKDDEGKPLTTTSVSDYAKAQAFNAHNTRSGHYAERVDERRAYRRIRKRMKAQIRRAQGQTAEGSLLGAAIPDKKGVISWYEGTVAA